MRPTVLATPLPAPSIPRGCAVGLVARSGPELDAACSALGSRAAFAVADVAEMDQVERAVTDITEKLGMPDILVNNAGIGAYGAMLDQETGLFERLMRVNYLGTVNTTLAVLPAMVERRRGHIVNIASIAGRLGAPFRGSRSASKIRGRRAERVSRRRSPGLGHWRLAREPWPSGYEVR